MPYHGILGRLSFAWKHEDKCGWWGRTHVRDTQIRTLKLYLIILVYIPIFKTFTDSESSVFYSWHFIWLSKDYVADVAFLSRSKNSQKIEAPPLWPEETFCCSANEKKSTLYSVGNMSRDEHQPEGSGEKVERWKGREKRERDWSFPLQLLNSTSCLSGKILRGQISSDKTRAQCFNMHTGTEQAVKGDAHTEIHLPSSSRRVLRNLKVWGLSAFERVVEHAEMAEP